MAPPYGEPDWATPGATSAATTETTQNAATGGNITAASASGTGGGGRDKARIVLVLLSFIDVLLAVMMTALGVLTLIQFSGVADTAAAFLATYMIIFAGLLGTYELLWWVGIPSVNKVLRRNFGFLYGLRGRGLYLIFVAFLCLGLKNDNFDQTVKILTWATGISYLAVGVLHLFIVCVHPAITEKYRAPTAGLSSTNKDHGEGGEATTPNPV